jgi:hypothetical protein
METPADTNKTHIRIISRSVTSAAIPKSHILTPNSYHQVIHALLFFTVKTTKNKSLHVKHSILIYER